MSLRQPGTYEPFSPKTKTKERHWKKFAKYRSQGNICARKIQDVLEDTVLFFLRAEVLHFRSVIAQVHACLKLKTKGTAYTHNSFKGRQLYPSPGADKDLRVWVHAAQDLRVHHKSVQVPQQGMQPLGSPISIEASLSWLPTASSHSFSASSSVWTCDGGGGRHKCAAVSCGCHRQTPGSVLTSQFVWDRVFHDL